LTGVKKKKNRLALTEVIIIKAFGTICPEAFFNVVKFCNEKWHFCDFRKGYFMLKMGYIICNPHWDKHVWGK
jgi:hypothetical protein